MRLLSLLFSFLLMLGGGCAGPLPIGTTAASARSTGSMPMGNETAYLALGDSYTIGEGVSEAERWPVQLAALARQQGIGVKAPDIIARTGWTTSELQTAIAAANKPATYGLVSLLIGVNNQYRGQSVVRYRTEFRELLRTAVGLANGRANRVFVLSIPDWGQSPFARKQRQDPAQIGLEIDGFNTVAQDECQRAGVAYVNITPQTRATAGGANQFAHDGLHYSGPQMHQWAQLALPVIRGLLN
ncbi:GDSL-type esterase/lipase family protein [Hymenobacter negativus]|uniref:SGNH/GDSL hydrolase family protein n=1 Tax=Hymenobacter negativus TaxID=2795026 RepID=A0ABS3QJB7_9BACT|nr:GDSL-type esterase/lipase family protein [Hymenobacter negativus]MBO2011345.1 SGNH/GDSL hydrolase family protein [Hymenobacter negativus]